MTLREAAEGMKAAQDQCADARACLHATAADYQNRATVTEHRMYLTAVTSPLPALAIEAADTIARLEAENAKLQAELAMWKPLSPEEADRAFAEAVAEPISDECINEIVAKVTDPAYQPTEPEHVLLAAKVRQLQAELAALRERDHQKGD